MKSVRYACYFPLALTKNLMAYLTNVISHDNMGFRVEMNDDIGEVIYEYDAIGNATKCLATRLF